MKHLFLINPTAGKADRTTELSPKIAEACRARDLDFNIEISHRPGDCLALARAAAETGEEYRIYACGGDGTLNEIINGAAGFHNVSVTHYPIGSGNDFIKASSDPTAFLDLSRLLDPEEHRFDLIEVGDHKLGLDICSIGIDARIGAQMVEFKRLPLLSGSGAYLLSTFVNVIKGIHRHYVIEIDGQYIDSRQTLICACNGRWYGGSFNPMPDAVLDDGLLDVLLVEPVSRLQVASIIGRYKSGCYRDFPDLMHHYRVRELTVHCDEPTQINYDGEMLTAKDITFRISQQKIRFFCPKGLSWAARPAT